DQLPLMQHSLNQMWHRASPANPGDKVVLTRADYKGLERELDEHAESIVDRLGPDYLPLTEKLFQALTEGTTVFDALRRPTKYGELVQLCDGDRAGLYAVLREFAAPGVHFLTGVPRTAGPESDDSFISISHESLIRQWKRLSEWMEEEGRASREWRKLAESVAEAQSDEVRTPRLREARARVEKRPRWVERFAAFLKWAKSTVADRRARSELIRQLAAVLALAFRLWQPLLPWRRLQAARQLLVQRGPAWAKRHG